MMFRRGEKVRFDGFPSNQMSREIQDDPTKPMGFVIKYDRDTDRYWVRLVEEVSWYIDVNTELYGKKILIDGWCLYRVDDAG